MSDLNAQRSRDIYQKRKQDIISLLNDIIIFCKEHEELKNEEVFNSLKENLENEEFSIVVVGEFSAGKSTLLNALMGKRLLPSFTNETTATVNFLRHIDRAENGELGKVFYQSGQIKSLSETSLDVINQYVSTKGKDVAKTVEHLDLYLDSDFLRDGVTLVDSPGLNGIAEGHKEITEEQIKKSHAGIFIFNSDHPGSKSDFKFLEDLQKQMNHIIFVLNKIDSIKVDEDETVETVIQTLKENYKKVFPSATKIPEIWPVSAYKALIARNNEAMDYHGQLIEGKELKEKFEKESGLQAFEDRLLRFLTQGEKAKAQLLAPVKRVVHVVRKIRDEDKEYLKRLKSTKDISVLEKEKEDIEKAINEFKERENKNRRNIEDKLEKGNKELRLELESKIEKYIDRTLSDIEKSDDSKDLLDYFDDSFSELFKKKIARLVKQSSEEQQERILNLIKSNFEEQREGLEERIRDINPNIKLFGLEKFEQLDIRKSKINLEKMRMDEEKIQEEIKNADSKLGEYKRLCEQSKRKGENLKELEQELKDLKQEERELKKSKRTIKGPERIEVEYSEGMVGRLARFFKGGKKRKTGTDIDLEDLKRYDDEIKNIDDDIQEIKGKIKNIELKIEKLKDSEVNTINYYEMEVKDTLGKIDDLNQKLKEVSERNQKEINEKNAEYIRRIKEKLRRIFEEYQDEVIDEIKKGWRKVEELYISQIHFIVGQRLSNIVEAEQKKLDLLIEEIETSVDEKKKKEKELRDKIIILESILKKAVGIEVEVNNIVEDKIEQIAI